MYFVLIPSYIVWHYTRGYADLFIVLRNLGEAIMRIFSLSLLIRTLFDPFERLGESYERGKVSKWIETFTVNTIMRIVGLLVRLSVILLGLFVLVLWLCFSCVMIVLWPLMPLVILGLIYIAGLNIIKAI